MSKAAKRGEKEKGGEEVWSLIESHRPPILPGLHVVQYSQRSAEDLVEQLKCHLGCIHLILGGDWSAGVGIEQ